MASIKVPNFSKNEVNKVDENYDYKTKIGIILSFFTIVVVLLMVAINNIYIYITVFTVAGTSTLVHLLSNNKSIIPAIFIYLIGISIICWQYRIEIIKYIKILFRKKNSKEHFYTLFTPSATKMNEGEIYEFIF